MATVTVKLEGWEALALKVKLLAERDAPAGVHNAVQNGADRIEQRAKANARERFTGGGSTGETERRIKVFRSHASRKGAYARIGVVGEGFSKNVNTGGEWGRKPIGFWQEYGFRPKGAVSKVPAKPFLRPALDDASAGIRQDISHAIEEVIRTL